MTLFNEIHALCHFFDSTDFSSGVALELLIQLKATHKITSEAVEANLMKFAGVVLGAICILYLIALFDLRVGLAASCGSFV